MKRFMFNGHLMTEGTPVATPASRGLRYGDGLFETLLCRNGVPIHATDHFARLWKGMQILGFDCPTLMTPHSLEQDIRRLLVANHHEGLARVRLQLFRKEGGLFDPVSNQPECCIESWELDPESTALNSNGLVLGLYTEAWKSCDVLANLKHSNYLPYILAAQHARQQKWNDALLLNQYGRICDSTIANIFVVKNSTLVTPALSEGCVAGIMRQHLLKTLPKKGIQVQEGQVTPADLLEADELMLTNSIRMVRWVRSFDNRTYSQTMSAAISQLLQSTID